MRNEANFNIEIAIEGCINSLAEKFLKWPYNFFTESDAHSYLYYYIFRSGPKALKLLYPTNEKGIKTVLIHREYPTSFRYRKNSMQLDEAGGRGHYDLVVLNPAFLKKHSLEQVIAKNYKKCRKEEKNQLLAAIEFKLIVSPLSKSVRQEIKKDFTKLSWALDLGQAVNSYMIVFNRVRPEDGFINQFKSFSEESPEVKGIYVESSKMGGRHYRVIYTDNWTTRLRYEKS